MRNDPDPLLIVRNGARANRAERVMPLARDVNRTAALLIGAARETNHHPEDGADPDGEEATQSEMRAP